MKEVTGKYEAAELKIALVVSRFNELISQKLLDGALDCLQRHNFDEKNGVVAWVPGALELSVVAKQLAASGKYNAVIVLGAVIQGETAHFDIVAAESAKGLTLASLETGVPVVNGVLTTATTEQALARAGVKSGNKGFEAAMTAIEMADLLKQLK
ncbi:6,7-dimethyl-8-ribityllumazine synthase [Candidatus Termititenax aidoneus]|uniref:6,7-dimethyl-8-ribityllumazine synthase n=1 Tax=Termititenax aidoneus TaxID=2218524 RepID=A0A388TCL9_TERA1|nr:6,7-dimethyl-8-ribityllumazine synthase [Candidatus Termititenax aidoneus]